MLELLSRVTRVHVPRLPSPELPRPGNVKDLMAMLVERASAPRTVDTTVDTPADGPADPAELLGALARHPSTPPEFLEELARAIIEDERTHRHRGTALWDIATNPSTPPAALASLAEFGRGDDNLLDRIAANPNTPRGVLMRLAGGNPIWDATWTARHTLGVADRERGLA